MEVNTPKGEERKMGTKLNRTATPKWVVAQLRLLSPEAQERVREEVMYRSMVLRMGEKAVPFLARVVSEVK